MPLRTKRDGWKFETLNNASFFSIHPATIHPPGSACRLSGQWYIYFMGCATCTRTSRYLWLPACLRNNFLSPQSAISEILNQAWLTNCAASLNVAAQNQPRLAISGYRSFMSVGPALHGKQWKENIQNAARPASNKKIEKRSLLNSHPNQPSF